MNKFWIIEKYATNYVWSRVLKIETENPEDEKQNHGNESVNYQSLKIENDETREKSIELLRKYLNIWV